MLHKLADLIERDALELAVLGVRDNGTEIGMALKAEPGSAEWRGPLLSRARCARRSGVGEGSVCAVGVECRSGTLSHAVSRCRVRSTP